MKRYRNLDGKSGVTAYECGDGFIRVRFVNGDIYEYTDKATGREHIANMQKLAQAGLGLSTYVSRFVHDDYARKL
ncbi:hypothetical protein ASD22_13360 [Rhodanobacter sp. Root480]|uniref:hypothetical protein n=1 Tax=Rhodanobacter sp. Root480 TaxID=1736542 RepID=UPI0006F3BB8A|nr:hypothetical protein [Rhodanobacter sp. Root480]KQX96363.1 hypothetical protein ASD22_13360 [Rhodanobacter sp. Root480]